ncbi:MAG: SsrA-binding protein SmpB [Candidatus Omnitrophota bacterium]|jgi:SsrA-binding protein|nr:MAG: SsrA-binding protein SmpB [Candidatus Omnitrophota bacterium]
MGKKQSPSEPQKVVASNRKARHLYHILETVQAGIALTGTEVKSLREGRANLQDSFAGIEGGEIFLCDCHISPYSHGNYANHEPRRKRKLLLHKREILRLFGKVQAKGFTLIPLKIYFIRGRAKVDIALVRGKKLYDKRDDIKQRDLDREMRREQTGKW